MGLATQPLKGDVLVMNPTITAMPMCQCRLVVEIVKCQVKIGSYNLRSCAGGKEGRLQLSVLIGELEGMGVGLCGLQELCWPRARECEIGGRVGIGLCGLQKLRWPHARSIISSYHLTCRGTEGKGTGSLCGLGLTSNVNKVWAY